jgi:hypothetical protein
MGGTAVRYRARGRLLTTESGTTAKSVPPGRRLIAVHYLDHISRPGTQHHSRDAREDREEFLKIERTKTVADLTHGDT